VHVVGDIDGDGLRDLVITSFSNVEVRSTGSWELFYRIERLAPDVPIGIFAESLGDVDGDSVPDFYYAESRFSLNVLFEGRVVVYSGSTDEVIWEVRGGARDELLGAGPRAVGDFTGDGISDLLVGRPHFISVDRTEGLRGELRLLDGRSGEVFGRFSMDPRFRAFGGSDIVLLGDTDGNGKVEVVVSARRTMVADRLNHGWVGVFELPDFELRYGFFGADPEVGIIREGSELGIVLAATGDVDLDGATDFFASTNSLARDRSGPPTVGALYLHSGRTGALLQVYEGLQPAGHGTYFSWLASVGDVDGDCHPEFALNTLGHPDDDDLRGAVQLVRYEPEKVPFYRGDVNRDGRLKRQRRGRGVAGRVRRGAGGNLPGRFRQPGRRRHRSHRRGLDSCLPLQGREARPRATFRCVWPLRPGYGVWRPPRTRLRGVRRLPLTPHRRGPLRDLPRAGMLRPSRRYSRGRPASCPRHSPGRGRRAACRRGRETAG